MSLAPLSPESLSRRTLAFVNLAHALDHYVLLIFPTAVIALAAERGLPYGELIGLATGAFVAFGLFSLPVGWVADRVGRRNLLGLFFVGCGAACLGLSTAGTPVAIALWLLALGAFSAIYHPVGSAMLVSNARQLGRDLGINGVWGNLGAAFASGVTALLAATLGWRASFWVPGLVFLAAGAAFLATVPDDRGAGAAQRSGEKPAIPVSRPLLVVVLMAIVFVAGGFSFNLTTVALPKVLDERLGLPLPLTLIGSLATLVFLFGALTQLLMGRLIDRYPLPHIFVGLSILQPLGLGLAAITTGLPLLLGRGAAMAALYGQVVVNDASVARYVPPESRAKAFGIRYFLGFTTAGLAVPLIGILHANAGFPLVLGAAAFFGAAIFASACLMALAMRDRPATLAAAE